MRLRHPLLVEEVAVCPVRVALHQHRAARDVVEHERRELQVVAKEVALRDAEAREEDLLEIREPDLTPSNPHEATLYWVESAAVTMAATEKWPSG